MSDRAGPIDPWVSCLDPAEWFARLHRLPALAVIFGGLHLGLCSHWRWMRPTQPTLRRWRSRRHWNGCRRDQSRSRVVAGDIGAHRWNGADEWGEEARMIDPYAELKLTAQRMEADGVSPTWSLMLCCALA